MVHRLTRAPLAALLVAVAAAAPIRAQGTSWQGVVTFQRPAEPGGDMEYSQGPGIARIESKRGEMQSVIIIDPTHGKTTIIMPSRQMYMTSSMKDLSDKAKDKMNKLKITNTGKTEVVAGHACTYYHAVDEETGEQTDACVATDMGTFATFRQPMGGGGQSIWQRLLGAKGGFFPLKVISHRNGKDEVEMVATKIEAKPLDPSLFIPPASYKKMDMSGMAGPN